ncbi:hypothetical protein DFP72DRAFT_1060557 [Ephemerocybe angulata]|uniref:Uncharacterized protein n=1 Tax=Ephemerocybe angulata TaxID=980116 RepID=A0A8H6MF06_9AGAR|nr:hypothetical protein DFP72DRAFT_1060557 [Tulosesus angulatus]
MSTTEPPAPGYPNRMSLQLEKLEDLSDTKNPARNQLISLFCSAIYSDGGATAASALITDCLSVCGGSTELLSKVLQTKFVDEKTPLHWVIVNLGIAKGPHTALPLLVKEILDCCAPSLSPVAKAGIEMACCERDDDDLYQLMMRHELLLSNADPTSPLFEDPTVKVADNVVTFKIPKFLDQMLVLKMTRFQVISRGALYCITFSNTPDRWTFEVVRIGAAPGVKQLSGGIQLVFDCLGEESVNGAKLGNRFIFSATYRESRAVGEINLLRKRNNFIGRTDRELSGQIGFPK